MEADKLNIKNDLLLQKTKLPSNTIERENKNTIVQPTDHIYFVICNSYYWCASYFSIDDLESSSQVIGCHVCNSHDTELIPISTNESFKIDYNVLVVWKRNIIEVMTLSISNLILSNIKYQYIFRCNCDVFKKKLNSVFVCLELSILIVGTYN